MSSQTFTVKYYGMPLRVAILQWLLVRTYCSAAKVLERLEKPGGALPPSHVAMLRHICHGLYEQIRIIQSPIFQGENRWP